MRIKALDYLIVALIAALVSVGLGFLLRSIALTVHPIGILSLQIVEAFAQLAVFYNLFVFIKGLLGKKQVMFAVISAVIVAVVIPLFYATLFLIFEGDFNLNYPINTLILSYLENLLELLRYLVKYFTITLFESADVVGTMLVFGLTVVLRLIQWIIIPVCPLIFALRDVFKGDEEYRFVKAEVEITHDEPV